MPDQPDEQPDNVESSVSRRAVLGAGLAGGMVVGGGSLDPALAKGASPEGRGTTLAQTLLKGGKGKHGYRKIVVGPGEPHLVRRRADEARTAPRTGQAPAASSRSASSPTCT